MFGLAQLSPDTVYKLLNYGVMPFWALLVFVPTLKITDWLVHSVAVPIFLGVVYAWLLANAVLGTSMPAGAGFGTLDALMLAFTSKQAVVAGWAHYIVFDLFVGAWQARDSQRVGLNHFALIPCLLVTFIVGPIGLLLYLMIRGLSGKGGTTLFEG